GRDDTRISNYEVTPLKIGETLYVCTPQHFVLALDAETGVEKWRFDSITHNPAAQNLPQLTCRGLSYHAALHSDVTANCDQRLFFPTIDARIIAINALTGEKCEGFGGKDGEIDLTQN